MISVSPVTSSEPIAIQANDTYLIENIRPAELNNKIQPLQAWLKSRKKDGYQTLSIRVFESGEQFSETDKIQLAEALNLTINKQGKVYFVQNSGQNMHEKGGIKFIFQVSDPPQKRQKKPCTFRSQKKIKEISEKPEAQCRPGQAKTLNEFKEALKSMTDQQILCVTFRGVQYKLTGTFRHEPDSILLHCQRDNSQYLTLMPGNFPRSYEIKDRPTKKKSGIIP